MCFCLIQPFALRYYWMSHTPGTSAPGCFTLCKRVDLSHPMLFVCACAIAGEPGAGSTILCSAMVHDPTKPRVRPSRHDSPVGFVVCGPGPLDLPGLRVRYSPSRPARDASSGRLRLQLAVTSSLPSDRCARNSGSERGATVV